MFWLWNWLRVPDNIWSTLSRNVKVLILQSCSQCLIVQKYISVLEQWAGSCRLPRWLSGKEFIANIGEAGDCLILGQEDPLEEKVETHSNIRAGKSHGQRNLAGYSPRGHKESDTNEQVNNSNKVSGLTAKWENAGPGIRTPWAPVFPWQLVPNVALEETVCSHYKEKKGLCWTIFKDPAALFGDSVFPPMKENTSC